MEWIKEKERKRKFILKEEKRMFEVGSCRGFFEDINNGYWDVESWGFWELIEVYFGIFSAFLRAFYWSVFLELCST